MGRLGGQVRGALGMGTVESMGIDCHCPVSMSIDGCVSTYLLVRLPSWAVFPEHGQYGQSMTLHNFQVTYTVHHTAATTPSPRDRRRLTVALLCLSGMARGESGPLPGWLHGWLAGWLLSHRKPPPSKSSHRRRQQRCRWSQRMGGRIGVDCTCNPCSRLLPHPRDPVLDLP